VGNETLDVEALFHRYGPMVVRRCRKLLRDEEEALDVAQEVFVRILKNKARMNAKYPSSLLYRIATNLCLDRLRQLKARPTSSEEEILTRIANLEDSEDSFEASSILGYLFGRHKESSRVIAVLHYLDGLTLKQVADEVGMSVSGVRKRLRSMRQTLVEMEDQ